MSKFDYMNFWGDCIETLAVSKEKYTKEQAIEVAKIELESRKAILHSRREWLCKAPGRSE